MQIVYCLLLLAYLYTPKKNVLIELNDILKAQQLNKRQLNEWVLWTTKISAELCIRQNQENIYMAQLMGKFVMFQLYPTRNGLILKKQIQGNKPHYFYPIGPIVVLTYIILTQADRLVFKKQFMSLKPTASTQKKSHKNQSSFRGVLLHALTPEFQKIRKTMCWDHIF